MPKTKEMIISLAIGLLVGFLTLEGQKIMPEDLNFLVNSAAVWMVAAYFITRLADREKSTAVVVSIIGLLGCVIGYYLSEALVNRHALLLNSHVFFWLACTLPGGIVSGLAGFYSRHGQGWMKHFSDDLPSALFLSEGLIKIIHLEHYTHMFYGILLMLAIGLLMYLLTNGRKALKKENLLALLILTAAGLMGQQLLFVLTS